jgi:hypothetical protein
MKPFRLTKMRPFRAKSITKPINADVLILLLLKRNFAMKSIFTLIVAGFILSAIGCSGGKSAKRGCPANDANLGAERIMAGEGGKKPSKFKIKGMDKPYSQ